MHSTLRNPHAAAVNLSQHARRPGKAFYAIWITYFCCLTSISEATTYCVDSTGTPSPDCDYLFQTVAEVNNLDSSSLLPGDSVLFKRGQIWRDTLVVPSSGVEGSPITIGAYGEVSDPKPVISCANDITNTLWEGVVANGGFEQTVIDQGTVHFPGWTTGGSVGHVIEQGPGFNSLNGARIILPGGSASIYTVEWHMEPGEQYTISGAVRAVTPGTTVKVLLYTLDAPKRHLDENSVWQDSSGSGRQPFLIATSSQWQTFERTFTGVNGSRTFFRADISGTNAEVHIDNFKITKTSANYWSIPRGSFLPSILIEDGTRLSNGPEWDETYRWHRVGGASALIRYQPPAGTIPTDHLVEIGERRTGIGLFNKNYISIKDLTLEGCEHHGGSSLTQGAGILMVSGSSHNTVDGVLLLNNDHGIRVEGAGPSGELNTGNVFTNFEAAHNIGHGIAIRSYATGNVISNCSVHDLSMLNSDDNVGGDKEAISIGGNTGNSSGNIVEHCELSNIGTNATNGAAGINVFNSPQTTIRYNTVRDVGRIAIGTGTNNASPNGWRLDDAEIYGNLILRSGLSPTVGAGQGIAVSVSDHGDIIGLKIYNNTIIDCELHDSKDGGISLRGVKNTNNTINIISNIEIKNNIVSGCHGTYPHALFVGSTAIVDVQNLVSDNNLFFPSSTVTSVQPFISYKGSNFKVSEFMLYQQTYGQDVNSAVADPLFVDATAENFRLTSSSPARDSGASMGLVQDLDGNPIVGVPDIGAFEFQP